MKISQATELTVAAYIREDINDLEMEDVDILKAIMGAAKQFIVGQTGMTAEECDEKEDLTLAYLMICSDMWDNRYYSMPANKVAVLNPAAKAIIDQYQMHIL